MPLTEFHRDGLVFDVRDGGPPDGAPVVLLHGFPQDASSWDAVAPFLHEAGLRTLAPDQRGISRRARPARRSAYRLSELVADVLSLLDAAGLERAHVVGHDWGGAVAWAVAGAAPDRVSSLTVVSTPHPAALLRSMVTSAQAVRSRYIGFFQLPVLPERFAARELAARLQRSGLPIAPAHRYAERMAEPGALTAALNWYRGMPFSLRTPTRVSRVPTTLVWGEGDFALGRTAAELTERFVRAPYEFVPLEAGHWLPETRPGEVAEAVLGRCRSAMAG